MIGQKRNEIFKSYIFKASGPRALQAASAGGREIYFEGDFFGPVDATFLLHKS